jgi:hypothetical protein
LIIGHPAAWRTGVAPAKELAGLLGPAEAAPAVRMASAIALRVFVRVFIFLVSSAVEFLAPAGITS